MPPNFYTECLLIYAEHCRKKRRNGKPRFCCQRKFLKSSEKKKTKNPTELSVDT